MSNIRRRRTVIGPGAPKDSVKDNVGSVQGDDSEKKRKTRPLRPVGTTAAGTRQSPLKRFLGLFFSVAIGWLGYSIIPKLSKSSILPTNYALCTHDESVYISAHEPPTQCVVVHKHVVVDTGTLEQTRMKYGDRDMLGTVARLTGGAMQGVLSDTQEEAGLKIYLLKRGQAVLPGLSDSHGHILEYGHSLTSVSLTGASSIQEVIRRVVQHIEALPNDKRNDYDRIIEGLGFDQTKWPGKQFPTAADLDVPQLDKRKIFLIRVDLHACWVSSAFLSTLDVPSEIPGGSILRNADGSPTGVFLDTAYEWVKSQLPPWTDGERLDKLHAAANDLLTHGLTGVHDAATSLADLAFYKKLDEHHALPLRIYSMVACPKLDEYCGDEVERYDGNRLDVRSVKLFLDGALGSWGAAMLEPYSDNPNTRGITRMSNSTLHYLAGRWMSKGFQINIHAIGDAANRMVIDLYESIFHNAEKSNSDLRMRLEHAQILSPDDIVRAGSCGLVASVQPTHCTSDMGYAETRIGSERIKGAYAWRSLLRAGCPIALGSDFPVESLNPFYGFYAAVMRLNSSHGSPHGPEGWYPSESLTRSQALAGFTSGAAWARFAEDRLGQLKKGYLADIVIVDRDIMRVSMAEAREARVVATIIDGTLVYGKL